MNTQYAVMRDVKSGGVQLTTPPKTSASSFVSVKNKSLTPSNGPSVVLVVVVIVSVSVGGNQPQSMNIADADVADLPFAFST